MTRSELIEHIQCCDTCGDAEIRDGLDQEADDDLRDHVAYSHPDLELDLAAE